MGVAACPVPRLGRTPAAAPARGFPLAGQIHSGRGGLPWGRQRHPLPCGEPPGPSVGPAPHGLHGPAGGTAPGEGGDGRAAVGQGPGTLMAARGPGAGGAVPRSPGIAALGPWRGRGQVSCTGVQGCSWGACSCGGSPPQGGGRVVLLLLCRGTAWTRGQHGWRGQHG